MRRFFAVVLLTVMLFTGCQKKGYLTYDMYAMNTVISLNISSSAEDEAELFDSAEENIKRLETLFSATLSGSEISGVNESISGIPVSDETLQVLKLAFDVAKNTNGAYDPTCLPLTELWNITDGGYLPSEDEIKAVISQIDHTAVTIEENKVTKHDPNIRIDLGGVAKGYALEKTVELLSKKAEYGMVSFGGNVGVWGEKPDSSKWEIGIKDPYDMTKVIGKIKVDEGYVSVSGDYERYFEKDGVRYHHIFDPVTGYPVDNGVHSVAVYTTDAALGDALSTALFVMGYDKAEELYNSGIYDFEALFVTDSGIHMTEGMEEMFINEN